MECRNDCLKFLLALTLAIPAYPQSSAKFRNLDAYITDGMYQSRMHRFPKKVPSIVAERTLTGGVGTTLTFTAAMGGCPVGVAGANTLHYLYISGGVGTAEAVLITGGTCTSGATSGTITFTPGNTHSGAWTIESATAGVQEAIKAVAGRIHVQIAGGSYTTYAPIAIDKEDVTLDSYGGSITYAGLGETDAIRITADRAKVMGLKIVGVSTARDGIAISGAHNWHIENVEITGFTKTSIAGRTNGGAAGISLSGSWLGQVNRARITGNDIGIFMLGTGDGGAVSPSVMFGPDMHLFGNTDWNAIVDASTMVRFGGEFSVSNTQIGSIKLLAGATGTTFENAYFENNSLTAPAAELDFVQVNVGASGTTFINCFFNGVAAVPTNLHGVHSIGAASTNSLIFIGGDFRNLAQGINQAATTGGTQSSLTMIGEMFFTTVTTAITGTPNLYSTRTGFQNGFSIEGNNILRFMNPGGSTALAWYQSAVLKSYVLDNGTVMEIRSGDATTAENLNLNAANTASRVSIQNAGVEQAFALTTGFGVKSVTFGVLPAVTVGLMLLCTDCNVANPCTGGGAGALAVGIGAAWVCK